MSFVCAGASMLLLSARVLHYVYLERIRSEITFGLHLFSRNCCTQQQQSALNHAALICERSGKLNVSDVAVYFALNWNFSLPREPATTGDRVRLPSSERRCLGFNFSLQPHIKLSNTLKDTMKVFFSLPFSFSSFLPNKREAQLQDFNASCTFLFTVFERLTFLINVRNNRSKIFQVIRALVGDKKIRRIFRPRKFRPSL